MQGKVVKDSIGISETAGRTNKMVGFFFKNGGIQKEPVRVNWIWGILGKWESEEEEEDSDDEDQ